MSSATSTYEPYRDSSEDPLLDSIDPLDSAEQMKIIDGLRAAAERQAANGRFYFRVIFTIVSVIFLTCLGYSLMYPFEMAHQNVFKLWVPHHFFHLYYIGMTIAFLAGGIVVAKGVNVLPRTVKFLLIGMCAAFTVGWAMIFLYYGVTEPGLYWLPLAPVGCIGLALWVDRDAQSLLDDVTALNKYKYEHKKL